MCAAAICATRIDADGGGTLDLDELGHLMREMGKNDIEAKHFLKVGGLCIMRAVTLATSMWRAGRAS